MANERRNMASRVNKKLGIRDLELVDLVIKAFCDEIIEVMFEGEVVQINNLGKFYAKYRDASRNPKDGSVIGPMFIPKFSFSSQARARVKSKKADYFVNEKNNELKNT